MKVTGLSALALPLFASLSSAFLVVDTIHHSEPSIWNYNEQKIRLVCNGCPWDGEGELSDLIFTVKANRNLLSINDVAINTANKEASGSALVTQVRHGHREEEGKLPIPVEFDIDYHEVAHAVDKPVSVNNAHISIKTVGGKVVDLRPLEIIHHVDGVRNGEISILRAHPGRRIACNTTACKIKQTANNGIKAFGFRITVIKGKIMDGAKALKAGCHGNKNAAAVPAHGVHGHGRPHGEMMHHGGPHGRPHPDMMMHHGRPHHGGPHGHQDGQFRTHHFRGHHHGILASIAVVLYPIFFGIAAGIFTSLVFVLLYKAFFAVLNAIVPRDADRPQPVDEQDVEAMGLLVDEKVAYEDEPPMYQDDAQFVVVVEKE